MLINLDETLLTKQQENSFTESLEGINQLIPVDCKDGDTNANIESGQLVQQSMQSQQHFATSACRQLPRVHIFNTVILVRVS